MLLLVLARSIRVLIRRAFLSGAVSDEKFLALKPSMMKPALVPIDYRMQIESLMDSLCRKQIDLVEKTCSIRIKKLLQKHLCEVSEFRSQRAAEKVKLKETQGQDLDLTQAIPMDFAAKKEMMDALHENLSKKLDAFEEQMKCQRRKLIVKQLRARSQEKLIQDQWLEEAKAGRLTETFDQLPLCDTGFCFKQFTFNEVASPATKLLISGPLGQHSDTTAVALIECIDMHTRHSENPVSFTSENAKDMLVESGTPSTHSNMCTTESVESIRMSAENMAISTEETLHSTLHEFGTAHSSFNVRNAAACDLDVVLTDPKATSGVEVPLENEGNHSLLSSTHATVNELDAIGPKLRAAAVGVDPPEIHIPPPPSNIITMPVTETDPMANKLQRTYGVDMSLQTKFRTSSLNFVDMAGNSLAAMHVKLGAASGVDHPLKPKTLPPTVKSAAANKLLASPLNLVDAAGNDLPAIHVKSGAESGVPHALEPETPPPTVKNAAADEFHSLVTNSEATGIAVTSFETGTSPILSRKINGAAGKVDTVIDNLRALGKVNMELDTVIADPEAAARAGMPLDTETQSSPSPHKLDTIDNNLEATAELDSQQHQHTISDSTFLISSPQQSPIQFPSSALVTELETAMTSNQALNTGKQEIAGSSGLATNLVCSSPQPSGLLASGSIASEPLQLKPINHNLVTSDCSQLQSASSNETDFAEDGLVSRPVLLTRQMESYQSSFSTQQAEVPTQQLAVPTPTQVVLPNQLGVQPPVQSVALDAADITSESSCAYDHASTSVSSTSGNLLLELFPLPQFMHPLWSHWDPIENELVKLSRTKEIHHQMHEDKKCRIRLECEKEIQATKRKYAAQIQDMDTKQVQGKKMFQTMYKRLKNNSDLAKKFRDKFIDKKGGTSVAFHGVPFQDPHSRQHFFQALQQQSTLNSALTSITVPVPAPAPVPTTLRPALASSPQSLMSLPVQTVHAFSAFPRNSVRSDFNSTLPPHANLQVRRQLRAPAPHLRPSGHRTLLSASGVGLRPCTSITQQQSNDMAGSASSLTPCLTSSLVKADPTSAPPGNASAAAANVDVQDSNPNDHFKTLQ